MFPVILRTSCFSALLALALGVVSLSPAFGAESGDLQSEGREALGPDRSADIQHLRLDLRLDFEEEAVEGWALFRLRPLSREVRSFRFHQVGLEVQEVRVDGEVAKFRLGPETLHVSWEGPRDLPPSEGIAEDLDSIEVAIAYRAEPTNGLHFRRPGPDSPDRQLEVWSQGENVDNRHWFPTFDDPRDRFTYEGVFSAPKSLKVLSNGKLLESGPDPERDGHFRWHYALGEQSLVSYLVMVAAGPYAIYESQWEGLPLQTWVPQDIDEATAALTVGQTGPMLDFFEKWTGVPYPYPSYSQVFVQRFLYTGMENTTATVMDRGVLHPERTHLLHWWSESVVAHELAHQWYGDLLTCRSFREMWLNEGFATFFSTLWAEERLGTEAAAYRTRRRFDSVVRADDHKPRPMVERFFARTEGGSGYHHPYSKGSSVLQMLRVMLGDEVFFRGISAYTQENAQGLVETADLRRAMEEASGQELGWFFDQWVYLAGHPKVQVVSSVDADSGRLSVTLRQTQEVSGLVPLFTLPIDVEIATSTGRRIERIWLDGTESSVLLPLEGELLYVAADPQGGLLVDWNEEKSASAWVSQLSSPHPFARERAYVGLASLAGKVSSEERTAVEGLLDGDKAFPARRAAEILGAWKDEASVEALLRARKRLQGQADSDPRLRLAVVDALGQSVAGPKVVAALGQVLGDEPVEQIRASALRGLGRIKEEGARSEAFSALRAPETDGWVLQRAAASLLGSYGSAADLQVLARFHGPSIPYRLRVSALHASVRIAERLPLGPERKAARRPIARQLELMTTDQHLRARQRAVGLLHSVGDARSIRALQALQHRENAPSVLRGIQAAIDAIRSRKEKKEEDKPGEAEARLKALEERLEALEKDLKERGDRL